MLKPTLAAKGQRVIACLLAAFLTCSMAPVAAFAAEEEIAEPDAVEPAADFARESGTESATDDAEESDTAAADCMSDVVDPLATDVEAIVEPVVEVNASTSIDAEAQPALGFVYIDEAAPESGSEQNIVFALSDESLRLASAILRYATLEGVFEVEARAYEDNAALFVIENLVPGEYELLGVRFAVASSDVLYEENLARGEYAFTVRSEEGLSTCEVNALSVDAAGQLEEVEVVEGAVESSLEQAPPARAAAPMASTAITDARSVGTGLIVALDPGHGGSDPGACANGLKEKDLTLSIARYCQALLQRSGISVIMTRTTDTYVGLSDRVKIAADGGATVFVSIHINSAIATTAQGCEVWVPNNSSYNNDTHVAGNGLGEKIVAKLTALGLKNRGVKTRDSENGSKYPNGSVADYYTVINGARQRGIPGIIVEHAFITNAHDAVMLASDAMLKKMGEADAQGIIEAINAGIIKGSGKLEKDSHGVKFRNPDGSLARKAWVKANGVWYYFGADGYALVGPQLIGGKRYYFNSAGQMMTGWMRNSDSTWTYCTSGGIVLVGWQRIGGCWYYLYPDTAKAACGSQVIAGKAYYFNDSCQMMTGWVVFADGSKSYYGPSGARVTGQAAIDGILYDFGEDGVIRNQIMGKPQTTVDAMAQDYESQVKLLKKSYPAAVYASKGAPTVRDFCQLIYDEAVHEGVRPAVLYAQVMHETGWLQFGGDVSPEQCNFGGLGATGGGNPGNQFPDVRTGLRAQVQHLKAYGSTEPLKNPCVDERFKYVQRGVAPYVADLAGKWAMDTQYGVKLNKIIDKLCG